MPVITRISGVVQLSAPVPAATSTSIIASGPYATLERASRLSAASPVKTLSSCPSSACFPVRGRCPIREPGTRRAPNRPRRAELVGVASDLRSCRSSGHRGRSGCQLSHFMSYLHHALPDSARIERRLQALWDIARGPRGGADRPAFSNAEADAMLLVAGWARESGLEPGVDAIRQPLGASPGRLGSRGQPRLSRRHGPRRRPLRRRLGTVLGLELVHELRLGGPERILICAAEEAHGSAPGRSAPGCSSVRCPRPSTDLVDADGVRPASARAAISTHWVGGAP